AGPLTEGEYHLRIEEPGFAPMELRFDLTDEGVRIAVQREFSGVQTVQAFADNLELDPSNTYYPLGQLPQPGSLMTVTSPALSKPGAIITLVANDVATPLEDEGLPASAKQLIAEYWDGRRWKMLDVSNSMLNNFIASA